MYLYVPYFYLTYQYCGYKLIIIIYLIMNWILLIMSYIVIVYLVIKCKPSWIYVLKCVRVHKPTYGAMQVIMWFILNLLMKFIFKMSSLSIVQNTS